MRVYAYDDQGNKYLVKLTCDRCNNEVKPHKGIGKSGWMKYGWNNGFGTDMHEIHLCPNCITNYHER